MKRRPVCVLASGGMDSGVLVRRDLEGGAEVQPVYVQAGLAWEGVEQRWLERYLTVIASPRLRPLQVLSLPLRDVYGSLGSAVSEAAPVYGPPEQPDYPGRHVVLLSKAAIYCSLNRIPRIVLGVRGVNPFPGAPAEFFATIERALSLGLDHTLSIERPLATLRKVDVVRMGAHLPLELTFSCIRPDGELHCGDCTKCRERQEGFIEAGVVDRTRYRRARGAA
jgi:7-cyano-7-deazaguanine synthase